MTRIDLPRSADVCAHLRSLVEAGVEDGPAEVWHDGMRCLLIKSIHQAACLHVVENPATRFAAYDPHPNTKIGARVAALLAAHKHRRAHIRQPPKTAFCRAPVGG